MEQKKKTPESMGWMGPFPRAGIEKRLEHWLKNVGEASWKKSALPLIERMKSVERLLLKKDYPHPDNFFFSIEDLPYMGKEYWFLYFVVPGGVEQVVITAGRSQGQVQVNRASVGKDGVEIDSTGTKVVDCAAVCWMYSRRKEMLIDSAGVIGLRKGSEGNTLFLRAENNEVMLLGAYPRFDIALKRGGKTVFSARASAKKKGTAWEMPRILSNPILRGLGVAMANYYFDYAGQMHGRRIRGSAYLQKVVATVPLAPWNWVRIQFRGGDSLDYFTAKPLGSLSPIIQVSENAHIEINGRRIDLGDLTLTPYMDGETRRWVLAGKGLFVAMESYALTPFRMRQRTQFRYDEYLVRVRDFALDAGGRTYTLKDLGPGSGIVEDAYGYLI